MKTLLTLQSSVLHGYVGNETAAVIYPSLGIEIARIDTIDLTAHPGHLTEAAAPLSDARLHELLQGFCSLPAAASLKAVHSGYLATTAQATCLASCLSALRNSSDSPVIYLLDPVLGDSGKFYVDESIASVMRDNLLPQAQIITPNAFELSILSGKRITDAHSAIEAGRDLLQIGPDICLATGIKTADAISDILILKDGTSYHFHAPAHKDGVSGAGDCLAALFFGLYLTGSDVKIAAEQASATTRHIMSKATDSRDMPLFSNRHLFRIDAA